MAAGTFIQDIERYWNGLTKQEEIGAGLEESQRSALRKASASARSCAAATSIPWRLMITHGGPKERFSWIVILSILCFRSPNVTQYVTLSKEERSGVAFKISPLVLALSCRFGFEQTCANSLILLVFRRF